MYCVLAVEGDSAQLIKDNLQKIEPYKHWEFEIVEHSWGLDEASQKRPDVLVLSRFLPGESHDKLLKDLPYMFSSSHIVLLVGEVDEKCKGYLRTAQKYGLENYVTGPLPGDRPYTLLVALQKNRDETDAEPLKYSDDDSAYDKEEQPEIQEEEQYPDFLKSENTETKGDDGVSGSSQNTQEPKESSTRGRNRRKFKVKGKKAIVTPSPPASDEDDHDDLDYDYDYPGVFGGGQTQFKNIPYGELVSVVSNKGGVGKTTTSVTLAEALSRIGVDVVIVDIDFPSPNVADFFNIEPERGIEALSGRGKSVHMVLDQILVPAPKKNNLYVVPGPLKKSVPVDKLFSKGELAHVFEALLERFPVVIADTPPNFRICPWVSEIFQLSSLALAVVDQSEFSEADTARFAPELFRFGIYPQNIRIILNRFSPKLHNAKVVEKAFHKGFKKDISKKQLPRIIATIPNDWEKYIKHGYKGETVGLDDAKSQWHNVAKEIASIAGYTYKKPDSIGSGKSEKKGLFSKLRKG